MTEQVQQVLKEEGRTMSEFLREAIRLYLVEREWLRRVESGKASCRPPTLSRPHRPRVAEFLVSIGYCE